MAPAVGRGRAVKGLACRTPFARISCVTRSVSRRLSDESQASQRCQLGFLWALGVGAVISGEYFGWNFGLAAGGFWGLTIATVVMAVMYVCMVFSISELSAALPHAGGFYSFTRNAFGPLGGFICGVTDTIEYVLTPAVVVVGVAGYLHEPAPRGAAVVVVGGLLWHLRRNQYRGLELTLRVGLIITCIAVAVLLILPWARLGVERFNCGFSSTCPLMQAGRRPGCPKDGTESLPSVPFAIWWYLAIESLPLAAEETHTAARDVPRALITGIFTMLGLVHPRAGVQQRGGRRSGGHGRADAPLADGLKAVFGNSLLARLLIGIGLTGLLATMHASTYAYGRVLFALSRAGYFPRWISLTHPRTQTPYAALILGGLVGLGCVGLISYSGTGGKLGAALLYMAVFGAVISYVMVMASYIKLRLDRPELPRPYRSPLGTPAPRSEPSCR